MKFEYRTYAGLARVPAYLRMALRSYLHSPNGTMVDDLVTWEHKRNTLMVNNPARNWQRIVIVFRQNRPIGWGYLTVDGNIGLFVSVVYRERGIGTRIAAKLMFRKPKLRRRVYGNYGVGTTEYKAHRGFRAIARAKSSYNK